MTADPAALLELAERVARQAGRLVRERPADLGVNTKSTPTDVVTAVDGASERLIVDALLAARPGDGVLGEEGGGVRGTTGVRWIVDPIDGTVNYLYGLPAYAVSVAAEVDGEVVAGAVLDVAADELYSATLGGGAACDGASIHCSGQTSLAQSLVATGFAYSAEIRSRQAQLLTRVLPAVRDIRRVGSAALDLCWVARGRLDAYFEHGPYLWDYAAGGLIAREAGAVVAAAPAGLVLAAAPGIAPALNALLPASLGS